MTWQHAKMLLRVVLMVMVVLVIVVQGPTSGCGCTTTSRFSTATPATPTCSLCGTWCVTARMPVLCVPKQSSALSALLVPASVQPDVHHPLPPSMLLVQMSQHAMWFSSREVATSHMLACMEVGAVCGGGRVGRQIGYGSVLRGCRFLSMSLTASDWP